MLRSLSLFICAILVACGSGREATPARDPVAAKQLEDTVAQRDKALARWSGVDDAQRQYCETKAGDCRIQVGDLREELISSHSSPDCRAQPDSELEVSCIIKQLSKQGDPALGVKFVKAELWCLEQLTECVAKRQGEVAEEARVARIAQRRNELELSPQGVTWRSRVAAVSEKIKYIRATLPPDADGECQQVTENPDCDGSIQKRNGELEGELAKTEADYDKKKAAKLYEQLTKVEASCYEPELKCLNKSVAKYGETKESRRWLERNFDLLDKRQRLIEKAGDSASAPCIETAVANHQSNIVQSYRAYVREPVLFFRTQLHRSFFAMHKSQVDCLGESAAPADSKG